MYFIQLNHETLGYDIMNNRQVIYTSRSYDKARKHLDNLLASKSANKTRSEFKTTVASAWIGTR